MLALIVSAPYLCTMVIVDRLLTVRKGFAFLSILSPLAWAAVAASLSYDLVVSPAHQALGVVTMPSAWEAAIFAGSASLLLHGRSLWIGLSDRGFVGLRLTARSGRNGDDGSSKPRNPWPHDQTEATAWFAPNPRSRNESRTQRRRGGPFFAALLWGSMFAMAAGGYLVFHHRTPVIGLHLPDDPVPLPKVWSGDAEASAERGYNGHFVFEAMVNGHPASMLFDTGASVVTLRAEEAARLGLLVDQLKFSVRVSTANGTGLVAATTIDTLTVGTITQHHVQAFVASPGTLRENLLGQSFLKNIKQVKVENNRVILNAN
ncbi:TIGR02281 family clan AA aspartic protease [Acidisphaera sp. S103]|uniref:retropepsin-like aspartic protease family protein n=1 Tax=Acidisphaera sp. S103 TaxID=1747223 RepID=UPI00131ADAAA|nr:TIGR02281 family clan AA aspartic protease [Acidisphaera sp. S103]